jgi:hypothetical protein
MPEKILRALGNVMQAGEQPIVTLKTAWKPNHSTPTLWFTLTTQRVVLFSTLRGGQVFKGARFAELNSFVAEEGSRIKILFSDTDVPDLSFQLDASVSAETFKQLLAQVAARLKTPPN